MKHSDFEIGSLFYTMNGEREWLCTDIGKFWIIAFNTETAFDGSPDEQDNIIFYEHDLDACGLRRKNEN